MSNTFSNPRSTFFADGELPLAGAFQFFDGDTGDLAQVFYDRSCTVSAPNPILINDKGVIPQIFGNKYYRVYQYKAIGNDLVFPADYASVLDFYWDASSGASGASSMQFMDSVASLKALTPANGDVVTVLGYYGVGDARARVFKFNSTSIDTPNDGNRIRPNTYGAGCFEENSSPVIYASDFGLLKLTGVVNANIAQLATWCNNNGVTCVFDKGIYNLSADTIPFNCKVVIEDGAYFNASGAFNLQLNKEFEVPQKSFGSVLFTLDVSGSNYACPSGLVPEIWGLSTQQLNTACVKCGASGLRIVGTKTLTDTSAFYRPSLSRFVFGKAGKLVNNATIDFVVSSVVIDGRSDEVGLFETSSSTFSNKLSILETAKSIWFEVGGSSTEKVATALDVDCSLFVNNPLQCANDVTFTNVIAVGGFITANNCVVTIGTFTGNKSLKASGTGYFVGCPDANSYFLDNNDSINGFIRSNATLADFKYIVTSANLTLTSAKVANMRHLGTITASIDLDAYGCVFSGAITAKSIFLRNCDTLEITINASAIFSVVMKNCITNGSITINSITTDKIDKFIIEDCYNRGSSTPLVVTNCLANSRQVGSVISVRRNTPECFADNAVPVGTWAQSYIDCQLTTDTQAGPSSFSYSLIGKSFALTFPNIDIASDQRLQASSYRPSSLGNWDMIAYTFGGASRYLVIASDNPINASAKTRVTGNLY